MIQQIAHYFETQPVLKAWLFGSYSRDEQKDGSDVDILVKFDRSIPIGLFAYLRAHTGTDPLCAFLMSTLIIQNYANLV